MLRIFSTFVLLCVVSACAHVAPGYEVGQYSVQDFQIKAGTLEVGANPEFIKAKQQVKQAYDWQSLGRGKTPKARLTLIINQVNMTITKDLTAKNFIFGENYHIVGKIELRDIKDNTVITSGNISAIAEHRDGPVGIIINATDNADDVKRGHKELMRIVIEQIRGIIHL